MKRTQDPAHLQRSLIALSDKKWWRRAEPLSGVTFLAGMCCALGASGVTPSARFGNPDGDVVMYLLVAVELVLFYVAFGRVGAFVNELCVPGDAKGTPRRPTIVAS